MITEQIIQIVNDAIDFQDSELGIELKDNRAPDQYRRWVSIQSHRCAGFSTAALMLLEMYTSSLIIYPNHNIRNHARYQAIEDNLCPTLQPLLLNNIEVDNILRAEERVDLEWLRGWRPDQRSQLIILDQASMIEQRRKHRMEEFRQELLMFCDVLVELN